MCSFFSTLQTHVELSGLTDMTLAANHRSISPFERLGGGTPGTKFLPRSLVDEVITQDIITDKLPALDRLYYSYVSDFLPKKVHNQARKVFAVLVLIGHESAIRDLMNKDDIADEDLPLDRDAATGSLTARKTGKIFTSFQSWEPARVCAFLEKQWYVLAPVLDPTDTDLKLDPQCPLPIQNIVPKFQGHGVFVYQGWLHPAHLPQPDLMVRTAPPPFPSLLAARLSGVAQN